MGNENKEKTENEGLKEEKPKKPTWKKVLNGVGTGVMIAVVAFVIGFEIMTFTTKDDMGISSYFGNKVLIVLTDSMVSSGKGEFAIDDGSASGTKLTVRFRENDEIIAKNNADGTLYFRAGGTVIDNVDFSSGKNYDIENFLYFDISSITPGMKIIDNDSNPTDGIIKIGKWEYASGINVSEAVFVKEVSNYDDIYARWLNGENIDITFKYNVNGTPTPMTHRVWSHNDTTYIGMQKDTSGKYNFTCHGINRISEWCGDDYNDCTESQKQDFTQDDIIGVVQGHSAFVGGFYGFISSIWGLLILIGVPALYIIISSVIDIVKAYGKDDDEEEATATAGSGDGNGNGTLDQLSKEERERLKQEMLDEMLKEKSKGGK